MSCCHLRTAAALFFVLNRLVCVKSRLSNFSAPVILEKGLLLAQVKFKAEEYGRKEF